MNSKNASLFPANLWRSFFYSPTASLITIALILIGGAAGWYAWRWGIADAVFRADFKACMANHDGACWGFVTEKWRLIIFGRYPYEIQWRPTSASATSSRTERSPLRNTLSRTWVAHFMPNSNSRTIRHGKFSA